jgi:hypothetical protein
MGGGIDGGADISPTSLLVHFVEFSGFTYTALNKGGRALKAAYLLRETG